MEVDILKMGIPILFCLLGIFAGYWFKNINSKTDRNREIGIENKIKIANTKKEVELSQIANEKAEKNLREDMSDLAIKMGNMADNLAKVGILARKNELDIKNLQERQQIMSDHFRK